MAKLAVHIEKRFGEITDELFYRKTIQKQSTIPITHITTNIDTNRQNSIMLTSQKNSFPLSPQNQEIHETSSELLIFLTYFWNIKMHEL